MPENAGLWGAAAIVAHPLVDGTLYACVGYQGIWKSTDCGATWTKTNTGRNGAALDHGIQFETILVPGVGGQPDTLYVDNWLGNPPKFFRSTNGGVDWDPLYDESSDVVKSVELDGWGNLLSLEPGSPQHIIADWHANCKAPLNPLCMAESKDSGATWRLFNGPRITDSTGSLQGWQEAAMPLFVTSTRWIYASHAGIFSTSDSGSTWTMLRYPGATNYYQVGATHYLTADDGVLSSTDGQTWTLLPGSHRSDTIVSTGTALYTGDQFDSMGTLWTAPLNNPKNWTAVPMPTSGVNAGSVQLAYDPSHHLLYSANHRSGLWRMVVLD